MDLGRKDFRSSMLLLVAKVWLEPRINIFKDRSYRADLQEPIRGTVGLMVEVSAVFFLLRWRRSGWFPAVI